MRYLSYYQEYPIYEPAEGGYYYPGNELVNSSRMSKRACRREFDKIWEQCQKENVKNGLEENTEDVFISMIECICGVESEIITFSVKDTTLEKVSLTLLNENREAREKAGTRMNKEEKWIKLNIIRMV